MPKVKLTESELRKVVATILNEQDPPALPDAVDIGSGYNALNVLPVSNIIDESPLCTSLADLCSLAGGLTIRSFNPKNLAYRYGHLAEHAIKEFGIVGVKPIEWNDEHPNAAVDAVKQYLKICFLSLVTGKSIALPADNQGDPGFTIGPDDNTDDLGYIVDPNTPTLAYWPGTFKNYGADDEKCLKVILPNVTELKVIASADVWNKLDNLAWVNAVKNNWQIVVRQADGKGFAYCDQPEAVEAIQAQIAKELTTTVENFNKTYELVDTAAFDAFFVAPLMYPSIWRAIKDETSPLYTPWSMTLSVCNMMNNALALPGGAAALAKKLTEASSKGIEGQGAGASISGFDPRRSDQFLFLRESTRIMVTLPELRRVIHAAFRTIISEQRRQNRDRQLLSEESLLAKAFKAAGRAIVDTARGGGRMVRSSAEEAEAAARLSRLQAAAGVDADVAKHYGPLFAVIEGLTDDVRAIVLRNIEGKADDAYKAILSALQDSGKFFDAANTAFNPKPGRKLDDVLSAPCVLSLRRVAAPATTPDILERVRVALNAGAALATAQRAGSNDDIITYTARLQDALRTSGADHAKIQGILDALPASDVDVNVNATARNLFGDDPTSVVASTLTDDVVNAGLEAEQKLTKRSIDTAKLTEKASEVAADAGVAPLVSNRYIRFNPSDTSAPGKIIELDPSISQRLGGKRYLSEVTPEEIDAMSGNVNKGVKDGLKRALILLGRAIADSETEVAAQESVVIAARRAVVNDASEGVVRGALTNVRSMFTNPGTASRVFLQGAEAAEGQGLLNAIGSLGGFKYDPDTADQFWAVGLNAGERAKAFAQFVGRITFFFEKGLPKYVDEKISADLAGRGTVAKVIGKVGQAIFSPGYARRVTRSLESLAELVPALKLDKLARTNWTKMWLTKSVVTALASIILAKTGSAGPQWEADNPWLSGFANLMMTINNPNMFQFGIFEVAGVLIQGADPTATFTQDDMNAIFDPGVPDLLINSLKSLDVNAKPDPGSFPQLLKTARASAEFKLDDSVADTVRTVGNIFAGIMNAGTDAGRSAAEAAEADLTALSSALQVQIDNAKAAAADPERGVGSLSAGNQEYVALETLRLDIIKTMISKIESIKTTDTPQFEALGYQNLNVRLEKTETLRSGWDIWYGLRNTNEMVAMSSVLAGSGPIGPSGAPRATIDDIANVLIESGAPVDPNDTTTPELQKLNTKFMKLSEQWQDLLIMQAAQEASAGSATPAAPAAP